MTDNEIIKAWAKCLTDNEDCSKCPLIGKGCHEHILDILNRREAEKEALIAGQETLQKYIAEQKAEIERLKAEKDNLIRTYAECQAEAVKEFAERLKGIRRKYCGDLTEEDIDNERRCAGMNRVEVWYIEDEHEIEETVNTYCRQYELKPISISVVYCAKKDLWVVSLVVEWKGGAE